MTSNKGSFIKWYQSSFIFICYFSYFFFSLSLPLDIFSIHRTNKAAVSSRANTKHNTALTLPGQDPLRHTLIQLIVGSFTVETSKRNYRLYIWIKRSDDGLLSCTAQTCRIYFRREILHHWLKKSNGPENEFYILVYNYFAFYLKDVFKWLYSFYEYSNYNSAKMNTELQYSNPIFTSIKIGVCTRIIIRINNIQA